VTGKGKLSRQRQADLFDPADARVKKMRGEEKVHRAGVQELQNGNQKKDQSLTTDYIDFTDYWKGDWIGPAISRLS
jgi:hypothetical protein